MSNKGLIDFEMKKFLGVINKEDYVKLSSHADIGFSFSKNDDGSMIFESAFLSEGLRKGINSDTPLYITEEEIKKSIHNSINRNFPVKFNHDFNTPSPGIVQSLHFDEEKKMLVALGRINHKKTAEDIRHLTQDGERIEVSVTVFGNVKYNSAMNRPELINLRYNELSIVEEGVVENTYIKMKD